MFIHESRQRERERERERVRERESYLVMYVMRQLIGSKRNSSVTLELFLV